MKLNLTIQPRFRLNFSPLVWVLLTLMGIAFVVAMIRYAFGIGAISDLSYSYPWGFWISFDLFTGVVISSGGFLMAGTVYILGIKEFQPLLRPSVLTAFIGYIMVAIALLVDLGQPVRIWYMMIHWNHTSVLSRDRHLRDVLPYRACHRICACCVRRHQSAEVGASCPQVHHAIRYPRRGALHPASILAWLTPAHPACKTASTVVDAHPADHVLRLCHLGWPGNDHP